MINAKYWIWLQRALGEGASIKKIIDKYGSIKEFYNEKSSNFQQVNILTPNQINKLNMAELEDSDKVIDVCNKNNWEIITPDDEKYPNLLRKLENMPAVIYCRGTFPDFNNKFCVSIVGARKASKYASECAYQIACTCAVCDAVVVSGGALGIDSAAHRGAISVNGITVAVLGCGLDYNYLKSNEPLRQDIINTGGALITEFLPYREAPPRNFPLRNRIVSGLGTAVVVVEGKLESGSLITAKRAINQGKDVYAVSGSILSESFRGTNKLIADGANIVTSVYSVIENYKDDKRLNMGDSYELSKRIRQAANLQLKKYKETETTTIEEFEYDEEKAKLIRKLDEITLKIYNSLTSMYEHIDIITQKNNMSSIEVSSALIQLEIMGLAKSNAGKQYRKG